MPFNRADTGVLSIGPDGLPDSFRIFRAGLNKSTKGDVLFDAEAARLVMAQFTAYGNDLVLDREHDSVNPSALASRADAADAQGYFRLSVAPNGDLIAQGVRYTPEGRDRLLSKKQRYISPFFEIDRKTRRVVAVHNVALTSAPATYHATALVAASARSKMTPDTIKQALDALEAGDTAAAMTLLKQVIVDMASGGAPADAAPEEPALESVAEGACAPGDAPEESKEEKAMALALREFTGAQDLAGAKAALSEWRAWRAEIDAERASADLDVRRGLVSELVRLGAEVPATAWKGEPSARQPADIFMALSLADLRSRVNVFRARPVRAVEAKREEVRLSAHDESLTKGMTPEQRERFINLRASRGAK